MNKIEALTESFRTRLDSFMIGCDSLEEIDLWDKETYGEMDAYYLNEFISTILRLVAADNNISEDEVDYLNDYFGFEYSLEELQFTYDNCRDEISEAFTERLAEDYRRIQSANSDLAEEFKKLLLTICDVLAESDGAITDEERNELEMIVNAFND